ncbi:MAG: D-alanine--D-alanine ligase [FCB group bacterium]|nr:D-alanine--D-alanine ligase [FCB group bacterium]
MRIEVLMGGSSSEREVSIHTGEGILKSLSQGFDAHGLILGDDLGALKETVATDLVFNALHGGFGENGGVQEYLERLGVRYTGSGPKASRLAMDKDAAKRIAVENGIPTPKWEMMDSDCHELPHKIEIPCVIKPNDEGSTFGLTIVRNESDFPTALDFARKYSDRIMIEEYIPGRELTVGILGQKVLPIVEIIPASTLFDYESKYTPGKSQYICPAKIEENIALKIQSDALKIYRELGCRHYGRVDFRLDKTKYYLLEVNTLPGMTSTSLLPKAARAAGFSYYSLINQIIKLAMENDDQIL